MDLKCNQCGKYGNHNGICKECFEKILVKNGEKEVTNFQIEDIDGCEFVKVKSLGNALISYDHDFDGFMTGKVQVVYSDGSGSAISMEEAQGRVDSGEWTIIKA